MKSNKILATAAAAMALLAAPLASQAAPVFAAKISDGVNTITINDGSAADGSTDSGIIAYTGLNVFGNWNVTFVLGTSVFDPLEMHMTASFAAASANFTTGESKVLTISLSQTGLTGGAPGSVAFTANGGGSGSGTSGWTAYADASDALFGHGTTVVSSSGYSTTSGGIFATMPGAYSATIEAKFDITGVTGLASGSQDITMNVPEPGTIALAGLALLGLGAARRRKA